MLYFFVRCLGDFWHLVSIALLLHIIIQKRQQQQQQPQQQQQQGKSVSLRSQELFLVAFLARYVAECVYFTPYELVLESLVVVATGVGVHWLHRIARRQQQQQQQQQGESPCYGDAARDNFPHVLYLVLPCVLLSWFTVWYVYSSNDTSTSTSTGDDVINDDEDDEDSFSPITYFLWTFSFVLEAVAIIPQLCLFEKLCNGEMAPTCATMMLTLALYKLLYIVYWLLVSRHIYYDFNKDRYQRYQVLPTIPCITGVIQTCLFADFFYSYYMSMLHFHLTTSTNTNTNTSGTRITIMTFFGVQQGSGNDDETQQPTIKYNPVLFRMLSSCCRTRRFDSQNATEPAATEAAPAAAAAAAASNSADTVVAPAPMLIFGNRNGCCCGHTELLVGISLCVVSLLGLGSGKGNYFLYSLGLVLGIVAVWLWLHKTRKFLFRQQRQQSPELVESAFDDTIQDVARMIVPSPHSHSHFMEHYEMIELMGTATTNTTRNSSAGPFSFTKNPMQPVIKENPLLQLQLTAISSFSGEDKQTSIRYRANTLRAGWTKQCSMTFQFAECPGGWAVEQAGSSGSLSWILPSNRNAGGADTDEHSGEANNRTKKDDSIDSALVHTQGPKNEESSCSRFVITKGFVSSSTGKAYWVEKDCDDNNRQLRRVIMGQFDPVNNSFSGEWQSSDGKQGHRSLDCTTDEELLPSRH